MPSLPSETCKFTMTALTWRVFDMTPPEGFDIKPVRSDGQSMIVINSRSAAFRTDEWSGSRRFS